MSYYVDGLTQDEINRIRRNNHCAVCHNPIWEYWDHQHKRSYLGCRHEEHEGIERAYRPLDEQDEIIRRTRMVVETKSQNLVKYIGKRELERKEATEIINTLYKGAPQTEKTRAILTCMTYKLNPLNNHVFLVPFNKGKANESWVLVMGIKAKRLLASRRGPFSYIDGTPRIMTEAEQTATFGQSDKDRIWVITKLQDPVTKATSVGYGFWLTADTVYGREKGNTAFNMASIRSESQALDRLRPGEMPENIEAADEHYVDGEFHEVKESAGPTRGESTVAAGEPDEIDVRMPEHHPDPKKIKRDPTTIKTSQELLAACKEDFNLNGKQVFDELNITSSLQITDIAGSYLKIAEVRLAPAE